MTYINVEADAVPFTPEALARHMIERYGDWADLEASILADRFFGDNQNHIAKVWYDTVKTISAIRMIKEAGGGSLNDYLGDKS
ncbi:MAG: hypothetical protein J0I19_15895 [Alphaproteobacteria bacterium]|nr:hypothetical protein [Alphaproteobacteria bacterium]